VLQTGFAIAMLAAFAGNLIHWSLRRGRLLYWPAGPLGWIVNGLFVATLVSGLIALIEVGGPNSLVFLWISSACTTGFCIIESIYATWHRHRLTMPNR
jgi:hypothetical protein